MVKDPLYSLKDDTPHRTTGDATEDEELQSSESLLDEGVQKLKSDASKKRWHNAFGHYSGPQFRTDGRIRLATVLCQLQFRYGHECCAIDLSVKVALAVIFVSKDIVSRCFLAKLCTRNCN